MTEKKQGFEVYFDTKNQIMKVEFYGAVHLKDIVDSLSTVIRHREFVKNMSACYDFSNAVVEVDITGAEVVFHFLTGISDRRGTEYLLALVYSDEMTKALCDFYRLYFSRSKVDVETFMNKEVALEWIIESKKESTVSYL